MIDTHAHLDFESYNPDREEMISRCWKEGLSKIITIGPCIKDSETAVKIAETHENIFTTVGIHPEGIAEEKDFARIEELAKHPKVVGIGECGFEKTADYDWNAQKRLFLRQLDLAVALEKALVIHIRDLYPEALELFKLPAVKARLDRVKWIVHSLTDKGLAPGEATRISQEFIALGGYISVNGIITFKKTEELAKAVEQIPNDRLLLETDCPYLAPVPHRGERNEPWMVKFVAARVAEIKRMSVADLETITDSNAKLFFKLP